MFGAFACPSIIGTAREPDHARSSLGVEAAGPEMINDRPLLVARAAMSPLVSRSRSMVSCPTLRSSAAMCWAVSTDSSSGKRSSESQPAWYFFSQ
jgi:hypothetical protein